MTSSMLDLQRGQRGRQNVPNTSAAEHQRGEKRQHDQACDRDCQGFEREREHEEGHEPGKEPATADLQMTTDAGHVRCDAANVRMDRVYMPFAHRRLRADRA